MTDPGGLDRACASPPFLQDKTHKQRLLFYIKHIITGSEISHKIKLALQLLIVRVPRNLPLVDIIFSSSTSPQSCCDDDQCTI